MDVRLRRSPSSVVSLPLEAIPPLSGGNVGAADKRGPLRGEREGVRAIARTDEVVAERKGTGEGNLNPEFVGADVCADENGYCRQILGVFSTVCRKLRV